MSKYVPKFYEEDRDLLVLDNLFVVEDCVDYASRHNLNVLLTVTTSASSVEAMMQFKKQGYSIELIEKEMRAPDGTKINPDIYALFTRDGNVSESKEKEKIVSAELADKANENISMLIDELVNEKVTNLVDNCPYWDSPGEPCHMSPDDENYVVDCIYCREQWAKKERERLLEKYAVSPENNTERKNVLTEEEIDCFNEYLETEKVDIAFGNSDWWDIYHKIVGDKISDYARDKRKIYI